MEGLSTWGFRTSRARAPQISGAVATGGVGISQCTPTGTIQDLVFVL